ncbi:VOC family protein [Candidimonas nitroreducens]|uniref:Metapyrocatechase n=1 Tax=Candidimonas nitroreducens TaxID=683354 RepID=A0A225M528_9BURK|nr:VOC family protein [Candidimonas nitroreducens]OWT55230.1 metapyrocatechase [Candidimonas nitroreducens]
MDQHHAQPGSAASGATPAGHAAVHSIDHYALTVPDIAVARQFFTAFGLGVTDVADGLELRAADGHRWARILPGARKALAYLSLNCHAADLERIRAQLAAAGARSADGHPYARREAGNAGTSTSTSIDTSTRSDVRGGGDVDTGRDTDGIWFFDPDGNLLQIRPGAKTMPDTKSPLDNIHVAADERGSLCRSQLAQIRPRRLSHVLLFTPDVLRAMRFYQDALGLRLSDRSGDIIAFMHAPHGCDHHLVAFAKSSARGWHHASWDVASVDEVGQGASQMAAAGYKQGWGTGRHVLGSNFFHYVLDPWGSFCEYSADIDYISAGSNWPAGDYPPEDSLYQWGPDVPPYFIHNTEAAAEPAHE